MAIKNFKELSKHDATIAGGKGASLGEMTQAGIPVPPGFVILSSAFDAFIEQAKIKADIESILNTVKHDQIDTVDSASEQIKSLILGADMPQDLSESILVQFKELDSEFVAVRSSATAEDSASAAWAGQLESYLNTSKETLLENVKRCWASLFTPRAIFYRHEQNLHNTHISVAVVVQKMVASEISGIAFSVHPVTEDYDQLIIEAGLGLGEAIVSGQITPDSYVVQKSSKEIIETSVATQERGMFRGEAGGVSWKQVSGSDQKLSSEQILELSNIIIHIENHYGFPCDIEWAFEKGVFYIVQSRPITTLSPKSVDEKQKERWFVAGKDFNSFFMRNEIWVRGINNSKIVIPEFADYSETLGIECKESGINYLVEGSSWKKMHEIMISKIQENPYLLKEIIETTNEIGNLALNKSRSFWNIDLTTKDTKFLLDSFNEFVELQEKLYSYGMILPLIDLGDQVYITDTLNQLLLTIPESERGIAFTTLTEPAYDSFSLESEKKILEIAVNMSDATREVIKNQNVTDIKSYLAKYDIDTLHLLEKHASEYFWIHYVFSGPLVILDDFILELKEAALANPKEKLDYLNTKRANLESSRKALIEKIAKNDFEKYFLELVGLFVWAKPRRKEYQASIYACINEKILFEIARRFSISKEDCLSFSCLDAQLLLKENKEVDTSVIESRKKHHTILPTDSVHFLLGAEAEEFSKHIDYSEKVESTGEVLKGSAAYLGKVTGVVKIINILEDMAKIEVGDILVSVATSPNIIPAMKKAAAFVTDEGGLTCHAAIVSREMEKPCVVGTKNSTKIFKDGDLIEVDANHGIVRKI